MWRKEDPCLPFLLKWQGNLVKMPVTLHNFWEHFSTLATAAWYSSSCAWHNLQWITVMRPFTKHASKLNLKLIQFWKIIFFWAAKVKCHQQMHIFQSIWSNYESIEILKKVFCEDAWESTFQSDFKSVSQEILCNKKSIF